VKMNLLYNTNGLKPVEIGDEPERKTKLKI
jgi:hypothetical protein